MTMKRIAILTAALLFMAPALPAQPADFMANFAAPSVVSPEINPDNSVTFRYHNPKAVRVQVKGDCFPGGDGIADMTETENGIWEYTTAPLPSEMYRYNFIVDGAEALDLQNVYIVRDVADLLNWFVVKGGQGDLYLAEDVPHGSVTRCWYGHLHGKALRFALQGTYDGIEYRLLSADGIAFCPLKIRA